MSADEIKEEVFTPEANPMFYRLWDLMCNHKINMLKRENKEEWNDYDIYAITTRDLEMSVWNGSHHPSMEANTKKHICKTGTRVLIWMVSRMGDAGVTDNLINPKGYDVRGLDADKDLTNYEFIKRNK